MANPDRTGDPGLRCLNLWLRYSPGLPAVLRGVSLTVHPGEVVALVGHNGAGKSTLVKAVTGAVHPDQGQILLDGHRIDGHSVHDVMASGVSCVWQELSVIPTMSVLDNLLLGMADRARLVTRPARARRRVAELVERCDLHSLDLRARVGALPFVERQRVEIARALASRSRYLLLDEPTAGQRGTSREDLFGLIRTTAEHGVGVLLVDHHLDEVVELAHRAVVLRDGVIEGELAGEELTGRRMTELMTGHTETSLSPLPSLPTDEAQEPATDQDRPSARAQVDRKVRLRCRGVSTPSLASSDLELAGGKVYGLYGLEGAGQAELIHVLAGAVVPTEGAIEVDGRAVRFRVPADAVRRGVVYLSGDRAQMLVGAMTGSDNLMLGTIAASPLWALTPTRRSRERLAAGIVERLDVKGDWRGSVTGLSGGNQQKLILGRVLQRRHAVVLMESPTLGVDVTARAQIVGMIRELALERHSVVCVASTDEDEVLDACDEVFVMVGGRIVDRLEIDANVSKQQLRAAAVAVPSPAITSG
jgi:ABC-type sugar transport system ATPase subunit